MHCVNVQPELTVGFEPTVVPLYKRGAMPLGDASTTFHLRSWIEQDLPCLQGVQPSTLASMVTQRASDRIRTGISWVEARCL